MPGSFKISCSAMSSHSAGSTPPSSSSLMISSYSQYLFAECEYAPAGLACVTLVVVTIPVFLPAF